MRASTGAVWIATVAAALALVVAVGGLAPSAGGRAAQRPCSSYPAPGTLAPAGTSVPAGLAARYALLRRAQRPVDKLRPDQLSDSLIAAGLIMSATRFLGRAADGGRIYLLPAEHLLGDRLAPLRCFPPQQRPLERTLLPALRREYRQHALCLEVVYPTRILETCSAATGEPEALAVAYGTPAFGLVPDGISAVAVTYESAPAQIVAVRQNFFEIVDPSQSAAGCGVQWLQADGNVKKIAVGCSYLAPEVAALSEYSAYVAGKLSALRSQVSALASAIGAGDLAQARSAWLAAHLTWLDIGQDDGAYGCFGELGGDIDGLATGHPLGTADPAFTGFHRIELDLWSDESLPAAAADTATLQNLLSQLMQTPLSTFLPPTAAGIGNWLLRPHEVLEDADRDSLTADDDYGSATDLASLTADVAAVQQMLGELSPLLDLVAPQLEPSARDELDQLIAAIDATSVNGAWVAIEDLPTRQRQQIDADLGAALETLAPIPDLLTSTGPNAPD